MPFELPAELPAVPRVDEEPDPRPAVEPPVPSVLDVPALPVPAALPPVPRLVLVLPLPALLPPVPSVLAEPLPLLHVCLNGVFVTEVEPEHRIDIRQF